MDSPRSRTPAAERITDIVLAFRLRRLTHDPRAGVRGGGMATA